MADRIDEQYPFKINLELLPVGEGFADITNVIAPSLALAGALIDISVYITNTGGEDIIFSQIIDVDTGQLVSEARTNIVAGGSGIFLHQGLIMPAKDWNLRVDAGHEEVGVIPSKFAGVRSTLYGYQQEQPPSYWVSAMNFISSKISGSQVGSLWGIGGYWDVPAGTCYLNFPYSGTYSYIAKGTTDQNEAYLTAFDNAGFKVWLQVEPGKADMITLISLVLNRYKQHPCVIGFGIDCEWLNAPTSPDGRKVTNSEVITWVNQIKSHNSSYKLFLKHFDLAKMPTSYPADVVFIDDSLGHSNLNAMVNEFKAWGTTFAEAEVGFQVGYQEDKSWWKNLADPVATIGNTLYAQIPNMKYYYWVDFSIRDIY